jgi:hypothetical protein
MALFRRRSSRDEAVDEPRDDLAGDVGPEEDDELLDGEQDAPEAGTAAARPAAERRDGPFDESEADLADPSVPRLDLGSLRIPGLPGIGVQVEADQATGAVRAVTAVLSDAGVQLQAFAAPRTEGLWDELREEMLAELAATPQAKVTEHDGPFGPEVRAIVPGRGPDGQQVLQALRFTGVDGPRWFLRAVFLGRAAVEPDPDDVLHALVRQTIVVRGTEAMAPRDPLPLRLPEQPPAGMAEAGDLPGAGAGAGEVEPDAGVDDPVDDLDLVDDEADDADEAPSRFTGIDPFERGPEITEIR